jgi:DNA (cytosine-5)-methyltransferase 1
MAVVGLFAGIGGLEKGFAQHGFHTSLLAEVDPCAAAILALRFPDAQIVGDVADLQALPEDTSIVTAGFPCQNLSMAGDKSGIDGTKSGIVEELFRLIEYSHVPTVVIENVYFMLQLDRGRAMRKLTERFEELNYLWAYRVLDTAGFGLPHRRRRVYTVASRCIDPRAVLLADEAPARELSSPSIDKPLGFYWTEGRSGIGLTVDGIPPLKGGSGLGIPSAPAVLFPDGRVLMPGLSACERLQGFDEGWISLPSPSFARNPQWRLLGNAVSVPVASWLASRLARPGIPLQLDRWKLESGHRWPDAAFNIGEGPIGAKASDKPIVCSTPSIESFYDSSWSRLSARALDGFLSRAMQGGLRFPEGFLDLISRAERKNVAA